MFPQRVGPKDRGKGRPRVGSTATAPAALRLTGDAFVKGDAEGGDLGVREADEQPPEEVPVLIPGTCGYVSSHNKRGFVDVIQGRVLRGGDYPG